jgi:hypothetical protein
MKIQLRFVAAVVTVLLGTALLFARGVAAAPPVTTVVGSQPVVAEQTSRQPFVRQPFVQQPFVRQPFVRPFVRQPFVRPFFNPFFNVDVDPFLFNAEQRPFFIGD